MPHRKLFAWLLLAAAACLSATPAPTAQVLPEPTVDAASGAAGSVSPEPVRHRARPLQTRLVYSCIAAGLVTYADRPCGPASRARELKLRSPAVTVAGTGPEVGAAKDEAAAAIKRAAAAKADAAAVRAAADRAATCEQLEATLDAIDSQMRSGYPAREAGRLWERWRAARASLREARC